MKSTLNDNNYKVNNQSKDTIERLTCKEVYFFLSGDQSHRKERITENQLKGKISPMEAWWKRQGNHVGVQLQLASITRT